MAESTYVVPDAIRNAAKHGELVVFVGAGVSALCGSPDWQGFANAVVDQVGRPAGLSFLEIEQLRNIGDPRRRLSIAMDLANKAGIDVKYEAILHPTSGREAGLEAYRLLSALNPVFVTTNYDKWFDTTPSPPLADPDAEVGPDAVAGAEKRVIVVGRDKLTTDMLFKRGAVFHLHGRYTEPTSMVVSLRDYISHYGDVRIIAFLRELFSKWTVLFVGYGLAELEVIEYVIKAASPEGGLPESEIRHHILYGYRSSEAAQTTFIERFFENECNVGVIKYKIDDAGWEELINVLQAWQPQVDTRDASLIEMQQYLTQRIANGSASTDRQAAIRLIARRPELQPYFFNNVADLAWFDDLFEGHFFSPSNNSHPTATHSADRTTYSPSRWPAIGYLERIAGDAAGPRAVRLLQLIRDITEDSVARGVDNWITNWALAKAFSRMATDIIERRDVDLVRVWLRSMFNVDMIGHTLGMQLLPRLLQDGEGESAHVALDLVEALTGVRSAAVGERRHGIVGDYHVRETLRKSADLLGRRCKQDAVRALSRSLIESIGSPEDDARSYWWRSAIETHEQDRYHDDLRSALIDGVRDAAVGCISENVDDGREAVTELLKSSHPSLVRIGIFACGARYGEVGDIFWSECHPGWFQDPVYWHEVYWFIRKGFRRFSAAHRQSYLDAVAGYHRDWSDVARQDELDDRHRRDLLHPAQGQGDPQVDELYRRLADRYGQPRENLDFHVFSTSGWSGERSPIGVSELLQFDNQELLAYLREFQPSEGWEGSTTTGLADTLAEALRASDDAFSNRLAAFAEMHAAFQHGIFKGLKVRWTEDKKEIDWATSLGLASAIIQASNFLSAVTTDDESGSEPSVHWVSNDILDLLRAGIDDDDRAMPPELLPTALAIAEVVVRAYPTNPANGSTDAVTDAINTPRGRALELIIRLLLHASRLKSRDIQTAIAWDIVRPLFDAELVMSEAGGNADFAAHAGTYISNLHHLAPEWVEANFDRLFSKANAAAWSCAAQGFAYQRYMYDWLYSRLKSGGHLSRMLEEDESLREPVLEKALQFLALAYIAGKEPLEGSEVDLMPRLIERLQPEKFSRLCWFLWTLRGSLDDSKRARVLDFWKAVAKRIRGNETDHPLVLSALNLLGSHVHELHGEQIEAWQQAAPFAQDAHHGPSLVEELARLAPNYPIAVGSVFLAALDRFVPEYDEKDIIDCVRSIAQAGRVELAERICRTYAEKGSTLLNQTYFEIRRGIPGQPESH